MKQAIVSALFLSLLGMHIARADTIPEPLLLVVSQPPATTTIPVGISATDTASSSPGSLEGTSTIGVFVKFATGTEATDSPVQATDTPPDMNTGIPSVPFVPLAPANLPQTRSAVLVSSDASSSTNALAPESSSYQDAARSAADLRRSAESFESITEPITSGIKSFFLKILSVFSW